jgi:hypothetical protein
MKSQFNIIKMNLKKVLPAIAMLLVVFVLMPGCKKDAETYTYPAGTSSNPTSNATGVSRDQGIAFTFNEAMDPATLNSTTFTLKQGTTAVPGTVSYSAKTATFTPTANLAAATSYTATITTGAKSVNGNSLAANAVWSFETGGATSSIAVVGLGTAGDYVILAKTAITNNATSVITGDLGLSPAATSYASGFALIAATGYSTASQVTGKVFAADMTAPTPINLTTAVNDMITGYNDAAGRTSPDYTELATGNLGGKTLNAGLYKWTNSVIIPTDVTIAGGANDVWVFQIAGNLSSSAAVKVILTGGAQAKNIFWQVAGTVDLGATSHFEGIILSKTGITLKTGASLKGRALAQTAVVLDQNNVTQP